MDLDKALKDSARALTREFQTLGLKLKSVSHANTFIAFSSQLPLLQSSISGHKLPISVLIHKCLSSESSVTIVLSIVMTDSENTVDLTVNLPGYAAFIQQCNGLLPPYSISVDLQSGCILFQHTFIAHTSRLKSANAFCLAAELLHPLLKEALTKLSAQEVSAADARLMADYLSETYFEACLKTQEAEA